MKLKHLPYFLEEVNTPLIMKEVFKVEEMTAIQKIFKAKKVTRQFTELIKRINRVKFKELSSESVGKLKIPSQIDSTTYQARLEVEQLLQILNAGKSKYVEVVATVIAMICYSEYYKEPFSEGFKLKQLRNYVLEQEMLDCIGVFNSICNKLKESNESWRIKFEQTENQDPDFLMAGGHRLQNFNIISVIEAMCSRFNISIDKAWELSYVVVQNSLLKQSIQDDIQTKMTKIKERKMRARQKTR